MLTTAERISAYYALVEDQKHASPAALELRAKLEAVLGADHPKLRLADQRIQQIPILKAYWQRQQSKSAK